jgi:hypothetical protein
MVPSMVHVSDFGLRRRRQANIRAKITTAMPISPKRDPRTMGRTWIFLELESACAGIGGATAGLVIFGVEVDAVGGGADEDDDNDVVDIVVSLTV